MVNLEAKLEALKIVKKDKFDEFEFDIHVLSRQDTYDKCGTFKEHVYKEIYADHINFWYEKYC